MGIEEIKAKIVKIEVVLKHGKNISQELRIAFENKLVELRKQLTTS